MNRNQRRMAAYNASKAAQKIETANYAVKISKAFSKLSGEATGRVAKAMSVGMPRDTKDEGSCCLPEISLYQAGYRKSESVTAR